ncbi:MAG TPA: hypothetical protein VGV13_13275 [Methylomirabilota bacterium]|jgi:hypothetical protein|nr:hypothetical protein [Methylomirabilota bacterium]
MATTLGISSDLVTLDELARRLQLSPKTLRRLGKETGLPIWRVTPHGPFYAFWSEIETWARKYREKK